MERRPPRFSRWLSGMLLAGLFCAPLAHADEEANEASGWSSFAGKNEWLFLRGEFPDASGQPATDASIDLIRRFNKVLARNGIAMVFIMPPMKTRIYPEYLPDGVKSTPYMEKKYDLMVQVLRAGQVNVIDLNAPFLKSTQRNSDTPLFLRLDTHWSPAGAMLAAETIRAGIDANPVLKKSLEAIPEEKFAMAWGKLKADSTQRDMIKLLPAGSLAFAAEQVLPFFVSREQKAAASLLGDSAAPAITLIGSSYSGPWYGFSDALRYTLQRDILTAWVSATQGAWVGMETYLRDDSFQSNRPKLLIWEMPARLMDNPPDFKFREARYYSDNTEWLLRAAAWVQDSCTKSPVTAKVVAEGLAASAGDNVTAGKTTDQDFIELSFDKPLDKLDYLSASIATNGSKKMVLEASGEGVETRWFDVPVPGNGAEHAFKSPLPADGKGFTKLRIYPGKSSAFVFKGVQVCRQPEDVLE